MAVKQFILLLFIGFVWCKNENSLILDESFYDNGKWLFYNDDGTIYEEKEYYFIHF